MGKRTNTAVWNEKEQRWRINVQSDGVRKTFYSSKPGRTGQREANAKADAWLDDGIENGSRRVSEAYRLYMEDLKQRTSKSNWQPIEYRWKNWIIPVIGSVKISALSDQKLQTVINQAYSKGNLAKKSLCNLRSDMTSFLKFCRKSKLTTYLPEDLIIPAQAVKKGKEILQPEELAVLFAEDMAPYFGQLQREQFIDGFRLQVLTGLRPGELLGLRKSDRHGDIIHVQRSLNEFGELTGGKNDNARRDVVLSSLARDCWERQAAAVGTDELFPMASQTMYNSHLKKYCKYHGIMPVTPYGLRHTFVSIVKTLPEGMVKELVGHSVQMDTFGIYGHALNGDQNEVQVAIDSRFLELLKGIKNTH